MYAAAAGAVAIQYTRIRQPRRTPVTADQGNALRRTLSDPTHQGLTARGLTLAHTLRITASHQHRQFPRKHPPVRVSCDRQPGHHTGFWPQRAL
jgi:hypothetical protein